MLKPLFVLLRRGRRVRTPRDVDIPICLRVEIPRDTIEIQDPFTYTAYSTFFKILTAPPRALTPVPHFTRFNSVEDVELPTPYRSPIQRLD